MNIFNRFLENIGCKGSLLEKVLVVFSWIFMFLVFISIPVFSKINNYIPVILVVCFAATSLSYLVLFKSFHFDVLPLSLCVFLLYASLITLVSSRDFDSLKTYFTTIAMFFVLYEFLFSIKNVQFACLLYSVAYICFGIIFLVYYRSDLLNMFKDGLPRLGLFFNNENDVADSFLSGLVVSLFALSSYKNKFITIVSSLICIFCIILTGSRMAILGIGLSTIAFLFILLYKKHKLILLIILLSFFAVAFLVFSLPPLEVLRNRLLSILGTLFSDKNDTSILDRFSMMMNGLNSWTKALFTGYGAGGFSFISSRLSYSHATISEILCDFGIIGTFIFFAPQIYCLAAAHNHKESKRFVTLYLFGFVLIGMVGTVILQRKYLYILLSLIYSLFSVESKLSMSWIELRLFFGGHFKYRISFYKGFRLRLLFNKAENQNEN